MNERTTSEIKFNLHISTKRKKIHRTAYGNPNYVGQPPRLDIRSKTPIQVSGREIKTSSLGLLSWRTEKEGV